VRWATISGPNVDPEPSAPDEFELPGDFVTDDLRADCARFLDELHALIDRRAQMPVGDGEWVPRSAD
jgi:hypothetical protein